MTRCLTIFTCLCWMLLVGCTETDKGEEANSGELTFVVHNASDVDLTQKVIEFDLASADEIAKNVDWSSAGLRANDKSVPFEILDSDLDGKGDRLLMMVSIPSGESLSVSVSGERSSEPTAKRTHAELSIKKGGEWQDRVYKGGDFEHVDALAVPPEHTDHSFFIRYEGPGWESDKVGYRFYLDWRNAIDIFGKTTNDLVLQEVGLDGFDSYHEMADWGMDILKVGDALGIGALGCWSDDKALRLSQTDSIHCAVAADGNLQSTIRTTYYGWTNPYGKGDVTSDLSIKAGERKTRHDVTFTSSCDSLCTGIVKHPDASVVRGSSKSGWNYLATWGTQSLAGDDLGMAIFYHSDDAILLTEDEFNHVVVMRPPDDGRLTYYFAACWEQEADGVKTKEEFERYLKRTVEELDNEEKVTVSGI